MKKLVISAVAVAACSMPIATNANAQSQPICEDRDKIVAVLTKNHKEQQRVYGLTNTHNLFEVFASPSGSWTALVTLPTGKTCVIGYGESWVENGPMKMGDPA